MPKTNNEQELTMDWSALRLLSKTTKDLWSFLSLPVSSCFSLEPRWSKVLQGGIYLVCLCQWLRFIVYADYFPAQLPENLALQNHILKMPIKFPVQEHACVWFQAAETAVCCIAALFRAARRKERSHLRNREGTHQPESPEVPRRCVCVNFFKRYFRF